MRYSYHWSFPGNLMGFPLCIPLHFKAKRLMTKKKRITGFRPILVSAGFEDDAPNSWEFQVSIAWKCNASTWFRLNIARIGWYTYWACLVFLWMEQHIKLDKNWVGKSSISSVVTEGLKHTEAITLLIAKFYTWIGGSVVTLYLWQVPHLSGPTQKIPSISIESNKRLSGVYPSILWDLHSHRSARKTIRLSM